MTISSICFQVSAIFQEKSTSRVPSGNLGKTGWLPFGLSGTGQWIRYTRENTVRGALASEKNVVVLRIELTIEVVDSEIRESLVQALFYT